MKKLSFGIILCVLVIVISVAVIKFNKQNNMENIKSEVQEQGEKTQQMFDEFKNSVNYNRAIGVDVKKKFKEAISDENCIVYICCFNKKLSVNSLDNKEAKIEEIEDTLVFLEKEKVDTDENIKYILFNQLNNETGEVASESEK